MSKNLKKNVTKIHLKGYISCKYNKKEITMSIFGIKFGKSKSQEKVPFPESEQMPVLMNQYKPEEMENMLDKYILKAHHWNLFGNSFRNYEKYEQAENAYLKAIELDPKNEEPYGNLLSLYILTESYDNYESVYQKGMQNANPQDFIVLQDGRYQYKKGNYDMAYSAALSVLTSKNMQDEAAWVLGVNALSSMAANETNDDNKTDEYYNQAKEMHSRALFVFPNSESIKNLLKMFDE